MKSFSKLINKVPIIKNIMKIFTYCSSIRKNKLFKPPGHFYSPIPSLDEIRKNQDKIFGTPPKSIEGIDLNIEKQLLLLKELLPYYNELLPYESEKQEGLRYYYQNSEYKYSDAIILFCLMRYLKPKRIIEIGSGYSSCVMLDTNEHHFDFSIENTFIDPNPQRLLRLIKPSDIKKINLITDMVQHVSPEEFSSLRENDILFIDSTHVSKTYSDVNHIIFNILPYIAPGVYIHFHDIFYPFEYPKKWVYEGRAWNEVYLLRAFLTNNEKFEVVYMNTYMEHFYEDFFSKNMPLCLSAKGGSLWIRKK